MNTFDKVYRAVQKIPRGKVSTYGEIARHVGIPNPRVVGFALHANPDPDNTPCHRVVNKKGELAPSYAFGGLDVQRQLLEQEGVKFEDSRVKLDISGFSFT